MEKFLVDNKNALVSNDASYSFVHVVIGNEACDLDSTISALTYAYYLNQTKADDRTLYVPVLNIPRDDLCLRTETVYTLNKFKLSPECLTFRDQVDLHSILASGRLRTTVVDFHVFPTADDALTSSIVEIIDHRPKQKLNFEGVKVTIDIVGSCCTLVAEKLIANTKFRFNTTVAGLLHATILVDTICLNPEAKKVTRRDIAAVTHLENYIPTSDRKTVFNDIQTAKMNLSALSNLEIMRKDLKIVTSNSFVVAISSIPIHLEEFLQRPKVESDMLKFLSLKKADAVMIMAVAPAEDDMIERQLAIFSANHSLRDKIDQSLHRSDVDLDLSAIPASFGSIRTYYQGNVAASRKAVMPIVKNFVESFDVAV